MLAQMLHPAFDEKSLDKAALLRGIFEHAPGIGAVAAPLMFKACQYLKEGFAVAWIDAIFDGDQHRPAIVLDRAARSKAPANASTAIDRCSRRFAVSSAMSARWQL